MPYIASERSWTNKFCHRSHDANGEPRGCYGSNCAAWVSTNTDWSVIWVQASLKPKGEGWRKRLKAGAPDAIEFTDRDGRKFTMWERPSNPDERMGYCADLFGANLKTPEAMATPHMLRAEDIEIERVQPAPASTEVSNDG